MKCPGCGGQIEPKCQFVCRACWVKVPAKDRISLANMWVKRLDITSKLAKIVRELRAKNGGVLIVIDDPQAPRAWALRPRSTVSDEIQTTTLAVPALRVTRP